MSTPIKTLSFDQIYNLCNELGQPRYRADQLISWLFVKQANNYNEMSNLPKAFRATLAEDYPLVPARLIDRQVSSDGTRKYCFELADGARVEAVGIPSMQTNASGEPKSLTVCFSTQAGCSMQCLFCATGQRRVHTEPLIRRNGRSSSLHPRRFRLACFPCGVHGTRRTLPELRCYPSGARLSEQQERIWHWSTSYNDLNLWRYIGDRAVGQRSSPIYSRRFASFC